MSEILQSIILDFILTGIALFIAGKVTDAEIGLMEAILSVAISSLFLLVPYAGRWLSVIAYFFLLKHFTRCDIWPDLILLTVVSKFIVIVSAFFFVTYV